MFVRIPALCSKLDLPQVAEARTFFFHLLWFIVDSSCLRACVCSIQCDIV